MTRCTCHPRDHAGWAPLTATALMIAYEWSRVHLRDHTPPLAPIGAIIGALVVAAVFVPS